MSGGHVSGVFGFVFFIIVILIIFVYVVVTQCGIDSKNSGISKTSRSSTDSHKLYLPESYSVPPRMLFHGTSRDISVEIVSTGLWQIGSAIPICIRYSTAFDTAKTYAGANGAIVEIDMDFDLPLTYHGGSVWIFDIPDETPKENYFRIIGLRPVAAISPRKDRIL